MDGWAGPGAAGGGDVGVVSGDGGWLADGESGGSEGIDERDAGEEVGRTGARFGPYSVRRVKRGKRSSVPLTGEGAGDSVDEASRFASGMRGFGVTRPVVDGEEQPALPWASAIVRPYAHTGGRTRSSHDLALEALISTGRWVESASATPHRRMIMEMCAQPRSVAEVAALLSVPLGVVRVLLGDLATDGAVVVHATGSVGGDAPDLEFMQRVLVGLRRL